VGTNAAMVATSHYAASVADMEDEDELKMKAKLKLAANGQYILLAESEIRSEKGGNDQKNARFMPEKLTEATRSLYDYPKNPSTPQIEVYRQAHPAEVSNPIEFLAYMRNAKPLSTIRKKLRLKLLTVDELTEALYALSTPAENETRKEQRPLPRPPEDGKTCLTEEDIPWLRQQWYDEFKDILQGTPEELPPLREVNHEINLIDPDKKYTHRLPMCPVPLQPQFYDKLNRYVDAGWWKEHPTSQAAPLMCIPKKDR
jgi:hypothetical protein